MGRAYGTIGEEVALMGRPEGKRTLGRPRHRWVDNLKIDLGEIGWIGLI
jgi:hypothetical protein